MAERRQGRGRAVEIAQTKPKKQRYETRSRRRSVPTVKVFNLSKEKRTTKMVARVDRSMVNLPV